MSTRVNYTQLQSQLQSCCRPHILTHPLSKDAQQMESKGEVESDLRHVNKRDAGYTED